MNSNLSKRYAIKDTETKIRKFWNESGIFSFDPLSSKPIFSIDTPPPYVSAAHLHIGHAMSYIQGEIIARYQRMKGKNVFYPMGFDDNGLPTERYVEKTHKINKSKISRRQFIELCMEETRKGAKNYRNIWEQLGISVDWSLTYNTIGELAQRTAQRSFLDLWEKGLIYREQSPNLWCTNCQTAIAQADLDDIETDSEIHYIRFSFEGSELVIATTRPEMLPACVAIYVHPEDARYKAYLGGEATVPIFGYKVPIVASEAVDASFGTGAMMVCTWGDSEDVAKWKEDDLQTRVLIGKNGRLTDIGGHLAGMKATEARARIIGDLGQSGELLHSEAITQQKNVHERCGTPVEFNYSWQWYVNILSQKDEWYRRCNQIDWHPQFMKTRLLDWINGLKWDWCISRDRYYGVPFPLWHCNSCHGIVLADPNGKLPVDPREEAAPSNCKACGSSDLSPEMQVMDTWMTSSLTPQINARWKEGDDLSRKILPMDMRIQAFEIIRTWLFYTLVKSHYHNDDIPWKNAMISGWGLDDKGKKISKSKGNFVKIETITDQYGADAIRWWATNAGLGQNLRYSGSDLKASKKLINKLWNVARFCAQHIDERKFKPTTFSDRWILGELQQLIRKCTEALDVCEYNQARIFLEKFFWRKYCDTYLELTKNRTWYPDDHSAEDLASLKYTVSYTLLTLLKLFAPFLPFITEELYQNLFAAKNSIHIDDWPETEDELENLSLLEIGEELLDIISKIRHFKTNYAPSMRSEIGMFDIITDNSQLASSGKDLAKLANAKKLIIGDPSQEGESYETKHAKIIMRL